MDMVQELRVVRHEDECHGRHTRFQARVDLTADGAGPAEEGEEDDDNGHRRHQADDDGEGFPGLV